MRFLVREASELEGRVREVLCLRRGAGMRFSLGRGKEAGGWEGERVSAMAVVGSLVGQMWEERFALTPGNTRGGSGIKRANLLGHHGAWELRVDYSPDEYLGLPARAAGGYGGYVVRVQIYPPNSNSSQGEEGAVRTVHFPVPCGISAGKVAELVGQVEWVDGLRVDGNWEGGHGGDFAREREGGDNGVRLFWDGRELDCVNSDGGGVRFGESWFREWEGRRVCDLVARL